MYFSAEASFGSALVLGAIGGIATKKCKNHSYLFLAAIPLLFAIQQLCEGVIWLYLTHQIDSSSVYHIAKKGYLFFAFLLWPIWIPLSLGLPEPVSWRRLLLFFFLFCGVILAFLNFAYGAKHEMTVQIVHQSLQYKGRLPAQLLAYPLIVTLPFFISSLKRMYLFGVAIALSYLIAYYFYTTTFVSAWCFFASIASLLLYYILRENKAL